MNNLIHEFADNIANGELVTAYIFMKNRCLQKKTDKSLPKMPKSEFYLYDLIDPVYLGRLDGLPCYAAGAGAGFKTPDGFAFFSVRTQLDYPATMNWTAGYALHIYLWNASHRFCSRCGQMVLSSRLERSKSCPKCGLVAYPRISPAMIIRVTRGDEILLVRKKFYAKDYYALVSGFMEPGESVELCIEREVLEEVGITIKNIKYFSSQPWPFPDNIMLGYTAEHCSGELSLASDELEDARWFNLGNLPEIPGTHSIARLLINDFFDNRGDASCSLYC